MASLADRQLAAEGQLLMDKVKQHHIPEIDKTLWLDFDALMHLRGLYNFAGEEAMDAFSEFVDASYISVIRKIVELWHRQWLIVGSCQRIPWLVWIRRSR